MIIQDKFLKPFIIKVDDKSFDLFEIKTVQEGKTKGQTVELPVGYYGTLSGCLAKVARLKVDRKYHTATLHKYIAEYEKNLQEFSKKVKL